MSYTKMQNEMKGYEFGCKDPMYSSKDSEIVYENLDINYEDPSDCYALSDNGDTKKVGLAGQTIQKGIKKKDKKIKKMNKKIKKLEKKKKNWGLGKRDKKKLKKYVRDKKNLKKSRKRKIKEYKLQISRMQKWAGLAMFTMIDSHPRKKEILDAITAGMIKQYFTQVNQIYLK